ncbi:UNVERIFIED_CONTAM: FT-interacting protein 4 [Sesamum radiatum]|uniref:FT-interacting protein 4 n=1 Tax=Sesamum radiatum TaxID=300843 RepID=A0AAW2VHU5_SESRA
MDQDKNNSQQFQSKWNEQYTWEVFDPCTVITIGVFDNCQLQGDNRGERIQELGSVAKLHYSHPLSCHQIEILRHQATQIVSTRLSRSEPPLRKEVVEYMLDVGSNLWSVRRSKANHYRIAGILSAIVKVIKWFNQIRTWNSPFITVLVHILFLAFVCFPWMILSTIFLYLFLIGTWNYRGRPRHPPHMDVKLSQADTALNDELDEEFDTFPTSQKQIDILKMRYDRLRAIASRVQTVLGDMATQGERFYNLLSWRDPRATALFLILCLIASVLLYITPPKVVVTVMGFYTMRHPRFRDQRPSYPMNFLRRLPARTDSLL